MWGEGAVPQLLYSQSTLDYTNSMGRSTLDTPGSFKINDEEKEIFGTSFNE